MFKGLKLSSIDFNNKSDIYYQEGLKLYKDYSSIAENNLKSFYLKDNSLDATKIINSWFPKFQSDVFISHSHRDNTEAIRLAGFLKYEFDLTSFIDSCIWGYGNDLIRIIDNDYSWLDKTKNLYSYPKVLDSTSYVHMMLMTSLAMMIDKTECLMFYNTPNSIVKYNGEEKTESPWIYSEIALSQIVRLTEPPRHEKMILEQREFALGGSIKLEKAFKMKFDADTNHLKEIDHNTLNSWKTFAPNNKGEDALDRLYEIAFPLPNLIK